MKNRHKVLIAIGFVLAVLVLVVPTVVPLKASPQSTWSHHSRLADCLPDTAAADPAYAHMNLATHVYQTGSLLSYGALILLALMALVVPILVSSTVGTLESRITEMHFLVQNPFGEQTTEWKRLLVFVISDLLDVHRKYDAFKTRFVVTYSVAVLFLCVTVGLLFSPLKALPLYCVSTWLFALSVFLVVWVSLQIFWLFYKQKPLRHLFQYGALLAMSQPITIGGPEPAQPIAGLMSKVPLEQIPTTLTERQADDLVSLFLKP